MTRVVTLIIRALDSVGPDRVMRTSPVPDAQRSMETITPRYLRMGQIYHFIRVVAAAAIVTAARVTRVLRVDTGTLEPMGT
jgi:hypothetical protein